MLDGKKYIIVIDHDENSFEIHIDPPIRPGGPDWSTYLCTIKLDNNNLIIKQNNTIKSILELDNPNSFSIEKLCKCVINLSIGINKHTKHNTWGSLYYNKFIKKKSRKLMRKMVFTLDVEG
jgi:hypothetical protein